MKIINIMPNYKSFCKDWQSRMMKYCDLKIFSHDRDINLTEVKVKEQWAHLQTKRWWRSGKKSMISIRQVAGRLRVFWWRNYWLFFNFFPGRQLHVSNGCERSVAKKGLSLFLISIDDQPDTLKDRLFADDTIINNTADEPKQLHVTARQTQN